jgi:16S rRNA (adenine1518-N6/adenine1519-N6)-dimethyltransferase
MKRPFGQNFLFDKNILRKIAAAGNVSDKDTVVEIGPGLGTLTAIIAEKAKKVIAIEFDKKLIAPLEKNVSHFSNIEIVNRDALKFPYETIQGTFMVIANIPYNITTPLIFRLLEYRTKLQSMTLLMQREVAKRIVASPGTKDYGVLSLSLQLRTKPELKFTVSKKVFSPPPKVDSSVVHFDILQKPPYNIRDEKLFLDIVKTAFSQRRKTLVNSLKKFDGIQDLLQVADIDPKLRPGMLSMEDYARLSKALGGLVRQ